MPSAYRLLCLTVEIGCLRGSNSNGDCQKLVSFLTGGVETIARRLLGANKSLSSYQWSKKLKVETKTVIQKSEEVVPIRGVLGNVFKFLHQDKTLLSVVYGYLHDREHQISKTCSL